MNPHLKHRLKRILSALGVRTRTVGQRHRDLQEFALFLRKLEFRPGTVVDVGVADGTFELYEAFPSAFHFLVEPMREFEPAMKSICRRYNADYVIAAAGNQSEERRIYFSGDTLGASLLPVQRDYAPARDGCRTIPVIRLDQLVKDRGCPPPYLIKVDVQGFEHVVMEGATGVLAETEVVILETALIRFKEDRPLLDETIAFMKTMGFVPYDLFGGYGRPLDGALAQIDVAFVKENGRFRESSEFASMAQREVDARSLRTRMRRSLRA